MKIKGNIGEIPAEFIWSDKAGVMTKELGKYAGSEKIYANLDSIPPQGVQHEISQSFPAGRVFLRIVGKRDTAAE